MLHPERHYAGAARIAFLMVRDGVQHGQLEASPFRFVLFDRRGEGGPASSRTGLLPDPGADIRETPEEAAQAESAEWVRQVLVLPEGDPYVPDRVERDERDPERRLRVCARGRARWEGQPPPARLREQMLNAFLASHVGAFRIGGGEWWLPPHRLCSALGGAAFDLARPVRAPRLPEPSLSLGFSPVQGDSPRLDPGPLPTRLVQRFTVTLWARGAA